MQPHEDFPSGTRTLYLHNHHRDPFGFLANGPNFVRGIPGFSLSQTEPTQGNHSGQFWNGEGQQYLHQDPISPNGVQHGFSDSFSFHDSEENLTGHNVGRGSVSGSTRGPWNNELSTAHLESVEMSRFPSQDSIGAHSQRTTNSYDQSRSTRMYPNVNQMTFNMPSARSDITGRSNSPVNSALYTPTQPTDLHGFSTYPYPGEDMSGANPMFHRNSNASIAHPMNVSLSTGPYNMYATSGEEAFVSLTAESDILGAQGPDGGSMMYNPGAIMESPTLWDNADYMDESRRSSPVIFEEQWSLPPAQITASATNSPLDYSPSLEGISPRYVEDFPDLVELPPYTTTGDRVMRKPIGPRPSKVASDLAAASRRQRLPGTSETSDESLKLVGRSSLDVDNTARDHHLYHNVTPQADGLYHCPWEKDPNSNCQHKPEKLKCNYDKFVDSHLKPYKCKIHTCKELQFSSTACLLRHEREAHAMHGHGDKPFLCSYDGCERGVQGNGFPRHWNLRDHMKRVHNDPGHPKSNASGSPPPSAPAPKSKKRKAGDSNPDSPFVEKATKRIATPPVVMRQPQTQEPSLLERYHEKQRLLLSIGKQLADPKHADNMKLLREANDCIKVMVQTTQRINAAPAMARNFSQQSSG
ncbi:uncharacterized protein LY89DRAFT_698195 [Mollisia scopiformis]|uniref:C2H2-type domain-containing protein n=1 Tax=Mollisia scopiformis TaxID=149040 RepID=A0A194X5E7_MOLSC|nr:uncharacterized protein LY89DRAFT_698195 [Mollisia scopiformis]KUJ15395.1 hypothetical protein LY89DRAFT_698195 [Mollisia scopiformis]